MIAYSQLYTGSGIHIETNSSIHNMLTLPEHHASSICQPRIAQWKTAADSCDTLPSIQVSRRSSKPGDCRDSRHTIHPTRTPPFNSPEELD
jgi:hypothetical protein